MKKRIIFSALTIAGLGLVNAQVGINTEDPKTTLHVVGTNDNGAVAATDGVLVPRVNALAVNGTEDGQLVYLISDAGTFNKGFHFWNATNTAWEPIADATAIIGDAEIRNVGDNNIISSVAGASSNGTTVGSGSDNIIMGEFAARDMTTGSRNVMLGQNVGLVTTASGNDHVYVGSNAGRNAGGDRNVAIGLSAYRDLTNSGSQDIALGRETFFQGAINGNSNITIGNSASKMATVTSNNIIAGTFAGSSANLTSDNILLGNRAGVNLTSGVENIIIGTNTANGQEMNRRNILIGARINFPESGSGVEGLLNIQNAIFGKGNASIGTDVSANGKIGIGEPDPTERLDVAGTAKANNYRQNIEATTTIDKTKGIVLANANVSLPAPSDYSGLIISVRNVGTSGITFNGGAQTVNGITTNTRVIPVGNTFKFTSDGSAWYIISQI